MTIEVGQKIPAGKLTECTEFDEKTDCPLKPEPQDVSSLLKVKKVVIFGVPGAFTPLCSNEHLPGFIEHADEIKAAGADEIWCVAVNDAFVMGAWGRQEGATGKIRMLGDGSANWTRAMGQELDLTARNMGVRSQRYAAVIEDGVIKALEVEAPGVFEVSSAQAMMKHL
jgi:peroxiredoxin